METQGPATSPTLRANHLKDCCSHQSQGPPLQAEAPLPRGLAELSPPPLCFLASSPSSLTLVSPTCALDPLSMLIGTRVPTLTLRNCDHFSLKSSKPANPSPSQFQRPSQRYGQRPYVPRGATDLPPHCRCSQQAMAPDAGSLTLAPSLVQDGWTFPLLLAIAPGTSPTQV